MRRVRSRDTTPEKLFRIGLSAAGLKYKWQAAHLPGKPDFILPSNRLAIFIDGDFWHGGQWLKRQLTTLEEQFGGTPSKDYWLRKLSSNVNRDLRITAMLLEQGWNVIRFWESDVKRNLARCLEMTEQTAKEGVSQNPLSSVPQRTVAEFFAGIGLMRLGLEKEGWSTVFANDIDPCKHEMYKTHFSNHEHYVVDDIHNIEAHQLPDITLATASFPCNDLSLAGARAGLEGKQSSAFWGFIEILSEMGRRQPPLVLLENVPGFLTSHGGADLYRALLALNHLGYMVDGFIVDAARFVPQSRQRLFIIGVMPNEDIETIAGDSQICETDVRPKALVDFIKRHSDITWRIRNLPGLPTSRLRLPHILEQLEPNSSFWWSEERADYLLSQMSPKHRKIATDMIHGSQWSYGTVFRRVRNKKSMAELRTDGMAGCLRTPRGGSGRQILFKAGKGQFQVRLLTPRECARLMGADDYKLTVPVNQALFGFGDAVCVPAIQWIARHYLNPLVTELLRGSPLGLQKQDNLLSVGEK